MCIVEKLLQRVLGVICLGNKGDINMKYKKLFLFMGLFCLLSLNVYADGETGISIFSGLGQVAQFIKGLIVPDENYFHNSLAALSKHLNERLEGVAFLYQMLNNFFRQLNNVPDVALNIKIPDNFFWGGYQGITIDFLKSARPYIKIIRDVLSPTACLFTAIACYHKLRSFFQ